MADEQPASPVDLEGMSPEQQAAFGAWVRSQLEEINQADKEASQFQQACRQKVGAKVNDILANSLMGQTPKGPQYPAEVQAIANALTMQPQLIPAVDKFLRKLVIKADAMWATLIKEMVPNGEDQNSTGTDGTAGGT